MGGGEGGSVVINWDKSDVDGSALGRVAGGKGSGERRKKGQRESICISNLPSLIPPFNPPLFLFEGGSVFETIVYQCPCIKVEILVKVLHLSPKIFSKSSQPLCCTRLLPVPTCTHPTTPDWYKATLTLTFQCHTQSPEWYAAGGRGAQRLDLGWTVGT